MAIIVTTSEPTALLSSMKSTLISTEQHSWYCDNDGDFTMRMSAVAAWFRPRIEGDTIVFRIITARGQTMKRGTYALYHGKFIEMLLRNFDTRFSRVVASALASHGDVIEPSK